MKYKQNKEPLPQIIVDRLSELGFEKDILSSVKIEDNTKKALFITKILNSEATVINKTIYFRNKIESYDSIYTIALFAHEVLHIKQWNNDKCFLIKYIFEYTKARIKQTFLKILRSDLPKHWAHDQVSYEIEAIQLQNDIIDNN